MKRLLLPLSLLLCGMMNASAAEIELTADMFFSWIGYDASAMKASDTPANVDFNVGNGVKLVGGDVVCGTSTVSNDVYADLTGSSKLIITGTPGAPLRVLMNRQQDNSNIEKNPVIGENGTAELDLTEFPYVHINAIKVGWGAPESEFSSIKYVMPDDPLQVPKEVLSNEIKKAKLYDSFAKTEESFAALQVAISEGEAALTAEDATVESLEAATANIEEAIKDLALAPGYSDLTKEMYKKYASISEPGEGEDAAAACSYVLFEGTGLPYGDGNVYELLWADLSTYEKLILTTVGDTKPRVMMNRLEPNGQQAPTKDDSKLVDINPNNDLTWSTDEYQTVEDHVYTIDLKKVVNDFGFARLHSIKKQGYGPDVFVTGMYLYRNPGSSEAEYLEGETVVRSDVYTMSGVKVLTDASREEISNRLPKGIYIYNGKKIYLR